MILMCVEQVVVGNSGKLPDMAGHTLTAVGDSRLILIGGLSMTSYYSGDIFHYNASSATWTFLGTRGPVPTGIAEIFNHIIYHLN
jgi:hypothetical protein